MIGTVNSTPVTPNAIITGRRPIRSDKAPTAGWSSMNTKSAAALIWVAASLEKPEVLTRNFCR
ncbi:hypothetical protein D3C71_2204490 [compost metagenome]